MSHLQILNRTQIYPGCAICVLFYFIIARIF